MEHLSDNDHCFLPELLRTPPAPDPDWKQLIDCPLSTDERSALITSIFSDHYKAEMMEHLAGDDAQAFVDAVYETLDCLEPRIRWKCLRLLYTNCGNHVLLPSPLSIPLCFDPMAPIQCIGEITYLRKGQHEGRVVAAKCFSVYVSRSSDRIWRRFCREVAMWGTLRHPNVLPVVGATMTSNQFMVVSEWMENGNINMFVEAHPDANRMKLLADVARGLVYIHNQGILHGSLTGSNVLIDNDGHACISDFGLLWTTRCGAVVNHAVTCTQDFSALWMSPELLDPDAFGLRAEESRPTRESDCYALGMVIYEVLSGRAPFKFSGAESLEKIMRGDRPERPQEALFTDDVWEMLGLCWKHQPEERISPKTVLLRLEGTTPSSHLPSLNTDGDAGINASGQADTTACDL